MSNRRRVLLAALLLSPTTNHAQTLVVERIAFEGVAAFPETTVRHRLNLRPGVLPAKREIEKAIERVLSYYEEHGYPFCSIGAPRIRSRAAAPDTLNSSIRVPVEMTFRIDEGPIVLIDSIGVEGNRSTRREVITRELGLRPGDLYQQRRIDDGVRRLLRSGLFEAVDPPEVLYDTTHERFVLQVGVREGRTGRLDGIAGYSPGTAGRRGVLTGSVSVGLGNLFGSARRFSALWSRLSSSSADLRMGYLEPWVGGTPMSLEGTLQNTERIGYTRREVELRAEAPITLRTTVRLSCDWFSVIPDSQASGSAVPPPDKGRGRRLGAGLQYDTRDDALNPSRGTYLDASSSYGTSRTSANPAGTPSAKGPGNGDQAVASAGAGRHEASIERFQSLRSSQVLLAAVRITALSGYDAVVPLPEKMRLGGASSLRGYREEEFLGDRTLLATVEFRRLLSERSRIFLFVDAGQIDNRQPAGEDGRIGAGDSTSPRIPMRIRRLGYGAGVRLDTQAGIVGVDYGWGKGDRVTQGKLHVRLVNSF